MWRRGHCDSSGRERHTHERTPTLPHSGNVHGKRGRVGGRSGCGAEVTAAAVGESDTRTDGRPHCHTRETAHGIGCGGWGERLKYRRLQPIFGGTTATNR